MITDIRKDMRRHKTKKPPTRKETDIRSISVHHSLTYTGTPQAFANYHIDTHGWPLMAYAYVIQKDGTIFWCADHTIVTYHVGDSNKHSLGICVVGDFRKAHQKEPTKEQYESLMWLINYLKATLPNNVEVKGHQEYAQYSWKDCPTDAKDCKTFMDKVRADVVAYMQKKVEVSRVLNLKEKYMYDMLERDLKDLHKAGVLHDDWSTKVRDRKLTVDELSWLNHVTMTRHILGMEGKR